MSCANDDAGVVARALPAIEARLSALPGEMTANVFAWVAVWQPIEFRAYGTSHTTVRAMSHYMRISEATGNNSAATTASAGFDPYTESPFDLAAVELANIHAALSALAPALDAFNVTNDYIAGLVNELSTSAENAALWGAADRAMMRALSM